MGQVRRRGKERLTDERHSGPSKKRPEKAGARRAKSEAKVKPK